MFKTGLALAVALAVSEPAMVVRHDVDGTKYLADESEYPEVFALYKNREGHRDCVATLLSSVWAATAAHCIGERMMQRVNNGGHAVETSAGSNRIIAVQRHPEADIALVRLADPLNDIAPMILNRSQDEGGKIISMVGWGGTGTGLTGANAEDGLFRYGENRITAASDGWLVWRFDDPAADNSAALPLEAISGPGDSGGPAFVEADGKRVILGVSSRQRTFGMPEGSYGVDEYYVRVSWYLDWIEGVTQQPREG